MITLKNVFSVPDLINTNFLAIISISIIGVIILIIKKEIRIKILFLLLITVLFTNKLQSILNGFSYPTYRWIFILTLLLSYILVDSFDDFINSKGTKKAYIMFTLVTITFLHLLMNGEIKLILEIYKNNEFIKLYNIIAPTVYFVLLLLILFIRNIKIRKFAIITITLCSLFIQVYMYTLNFESTDKLAKINRIEELKTFYSLQNIGKITNNSFDRVENSKKSQVNYSNIYNYPSVSEYYSIERSGYSKFNKEYLNSKAAPLNNVSNMDSRFILDNILSVKYHYGEDNIPYGFTKTNNHGINYNNKHLPFGFT